MSIVRYFILGMLIAVGSTFFNCAGGFDSDSDEASDLGKSIFGVDKESE